MNELTHYGVPGMKWGVRKSTYKSMDRAQRRITRDNYKKDKWQNKQIGKLDKLYGVDSWKKRSDKAMAKFEEAKNNKYATDQEKSKAAKRAETQLAKYYTAKGTAEIAKRNIKSMSLADIRKEQATVGATYVAAVLAGGFIGPMIPGAVSGAAVATIKQVNRGTLDSANIKRVQSDAHKKARDRVQNY